MNQSDRAWYYSPSLNGTVKRFALVTGYHDGPGSGRVNLCVFAVNDQDRIIRPCQQFDAVPVRLDYREGGPVDTAFCVPMDPTPSPTEPEQVAELPAPPVVVANEPPPQPKPARAKKPALASAESAS